MFLYNTQSNKFAQKVIYKKKGKSRIQIQEKLHSFLAIYLRQQMFANDKNCNKF